MATIIAVLASPVARYLGVAILTIGLAGFVYLKGHAAGSDAVALRIERAVQAERQRQQAIGIKALEAARVRERAAREEGAANRQRADELAAELAVRAAERTRLAEEKPAVCRCGANPRLAPGDSEKLNGIR